MQHISSRGKCLITINSSFKSELKLYGKPVYRNSDAEK